MIISQAQQAQKFREQQEEIRRRHIDELRSKDMDRRAQVNTILTFQLFRLSTFLAFRILSFLHFEPFAYLGFHVFSSSHFFAFLILYIFSGWGKETGHWEVGAGTSGSNPSSKQRARVEVGNTEEEQQRQHRVCFRKLCSETRRAQGGLSLGVLGKQEVKYFLSGASLDLKDQALVFDALPQTNPQTNLPSTTQWQDDDKGPS